MPKASERKIIGHHDKVDLPQMKLVNIDAKIDTGADSSSIHCHHIEIIKKKRQRILHFILLDPTHPDYNNRSFYFDTFRQRSIKNSFGNSERRYLIKTPIVLFGMEFMTEFSLSDRGNLTYPILLGKKFLYRKFIVDVAKSNLSYRKKSRAL